MQAARNIAGARADNTAGRSSTRCHGVNLADVWPTITRVGARRAEPEPEEGWRVRAAPPRDTRVAPLGSTQVAASERVRVAPPGRVRVAPRECWTALSYVYSESTTTEGVTVPGLMSTIHELLLTCTNREVQISLSVFLCEHAVRARMSMSHTILQPLSPSAKQVCVWHVCLHALTS